MQLINECGELFGAASNMAAAAGSEIIKDEHLLLAMATDEESAASIALTKMGVVRDDLEAKLGLSDTTANKDDAPTIYEASRERLQTLSNQAARIALSFGTYHVRPEHVLLAIRPDEGSPIAELLEWGHAPQTTTTELSAIGMKGTATVTSWGQRPLEAAVIQALGS